MKNARSAILLLPLVLFAFALSASAQVPFDDYFLDQALRIDLYQAGDAKEETISIHQLYLEGAWPETKTGLIPPFDYGRYVYRLYDVASNRLIFSRGFDTMFAEYKTTSPARLQKDGPQRLVQRLRPRPLHAHRGGP